MEDPYLMMRSDVRQALLDISTKLREYDVVPSGPDSRPLADQIRNLLRRCTEDVERLDRGVGVVSKNLAKYKITLEDVQNRQAFVKESQDTLLRLATTFESVDRKKAGRSPRASSKVPGFTEQLANAEMQSNNEFIRDQMQKQAEIQQQQDVVMEDVISGVRRIKIVAGEIQVTLDNDEHLMNDLENEMDGLSGRLKLVNKRLDDLLASHSDKGKMICIGILFVVVIILIVLMFMLGRSS